MSVAQVTVLPTPSHYLRGLEAAAFGQHPTPASSPTHRRDDPTDRVVVLSDEQWNALECPAFVVLESVGAWEAITHPTDSAMLFAGPNPRVTCRIAVVASAVRTAFLRRETRLENGTSSTVTDDDFDTVITSQGVHELLCLSSHPIASDVTVVMCSFFSEPVAARSLVVTILEFNGDAAAAWMAPAGAEQHPAVPLIADYLVGELGASPVLLGERLRCIREDEHALAAITECDPNDAAVVLTSESLVSFEVHNPPPSADYSATLQPWTMSPVASGQGSPRGAAAHLMSPVPASLPINGSIITSAGRHDVSTAMSPMPGVASTTPASMHVAGATSPPAAHTTPRVMPPRLSQILLSPRTPAGAATPGVVPLGSSARPLPGSASRAPSQPFTDIVFTPSAQRFSASPEHESALTALSLAATPAAAAVDHKGTAFKPSPPPMLSPSALRINATAAASPRMDGPQRSFTLAADASDGLAVESSPIHGAATRRSPSPQLPPLPISAGALGTASGTRRRSVKWAASPPASSLVVAPMSPSGVKAPSTTATLLHRDHLAALLVSASKRWVEIVVTLKDECFPTPPVTKTSVSRHADATEEAAASEGEAKAADSLCSEADVEDLLLNAKKAALRLAAGHNAVVRLLSSDSGLYAPLQQTVLSRGASFVIVNLPDAVSTHAVVLAAERRGVSVTAAWRTASSLYLCFAASSTAAAHQLVRKGAVDLSLDLGLTVTQSKLALALLDHSVLDDLCRVVEFEGRGLTHALASARRLVRFDALLGRHFHESLDHDRALRNLLTEAAAGAPLDANLRALAIKPFATLSADPWRFATTSVLHRALDDLHTSLSAPHVSNVRVMAASMAVVSATERCTTSHQSTSTSVMEPLVEAAHLLLARSEEALAALDHVGWLYEHLLTTHLDEALLQHICVPLTEDQAPVWPALHAYLIATRRSSRQEGGDAAEERRVAHVLERLSTPDALYHAATMKGDYLATEALVAAIQQQKATGRSWLTLLSPPLVFPPIPR